VRYFPRIAHSRTTAALLAVVLSLGATTAATADSDDLKDEQRRVEKLIKGAKKDLDHSSARLTRANSRLATARTQLSTARTELATARGKLQVAEERDARMQAALEEAELELKDAEADLEQGRRDRDDQRQSVVDTVNDIYMEGDPNLTAFSSLLDAESTEELTRRNGVSEVVVSQETRALDDLSAAEVLLEINEQRVEDARDDVAEKRDAAAANLVEKQQLEAEKESARESVRALVDERASARDEARKARASDLRKLRKHEAQQKRIEAELERLAREALRRANNSQGASGPSDGVLRYPVDTYITSPFGYRTHPIYRYWGLHDGIDFGGGCGVPLRAAASGTVVSSYWSDVYGHRLVVDHGARAGVGLATIYNHASSYTVSPGTKVSAGQVIGYQGNTGWSTACHLHFTVMANGRPVDPMNWF
jgi:murein DD-endopeptidase MepM/ murein hydrolase activator NlpD